MSLALVRSIARMASLTLMLAMCSNALAMGVDQVLLKNGDKITGRVAGTTVDTVSVETEAEGTIFIRRDAIARVVYGPTAPVPRPTTEVRQANAGEMQMQMRKPAPATNKVGHCVEHLKDVPMTWALQFEGAPNEVVVGTVSQDLFGAGLNASLCEGSPLNATSFAAQGSHSRFYEQGGAAITADVADAELEQQHFLRNSQGAAIFAVGEAFNNNALGMAMQKSLGVGLLSPQYKYKATAYDIAGDVRYMNQHLDGVSPALNLAAVRLKEQMHAQGKVFQFDEQAWIMPVLNYVHALQAYAALGPSMTVKPWLTLGIAEEESYLENAPYPRRKNYFTSVLTLTFQGGSGFRSK